MNNVDSELIHQLANYYWLRHGELIAQCLDSVPERCHNELLDMLSDHSSVFGSGYADRLLFPIEYEI